MGMGTNVAARLSQVISPLEIRPCPEDGPTDSELLAEKPAVAAPGKVANPLAPPHPLQKANDPGVWGLNRFFSRLAGQLGPQAS